MPKRKKEVEDSGSEFEQGEEEEDDVEVVQDVEEEDQVGPEPEVESDTDVVVTTSRKRKKAVEQTEAELDEFEQTDTFQRFMELLSLATQFELIDGHRCPIPTPKPSKGTPKKKKEAVVPSTGHAQGIFWDFATGQARCSFTKCDKHFGTYAGIKYHMEKTAHSLHLFFNTSHEVPPSHQEVLDELKTLSSGIIGEVYPLQVETKRYAESLSKTIPMTVLIDGSSMSERRIENREVDSPKPERPRRDKLVEHRTTTGYFGPLPSKNGVFRRFQMPSLQNFVYPALKHYIKSSKAFNGVT
jgi:hypothetical protein